MFLGFPGDLDGKESACNAGDPSLTPGSGRSPRERTGYPLQFSWGFTCGSAVKESTCNAGDLGSLPELGRSLGEGKGYPLQYYGLENSMDCVVHPKHTDLPTPSPGLENEGAELSVQSAPLRFRDSPLLQFAFTFPSSWLIQTAAVTVRAEL